MNISNLIYLAEFNQTIEYSFINSVESTIEIKNFMFKNNKMKSKYYQLLLIGESNIFIRNCILQ